MNTIIINISKMYGLLLLILVIIIVLTIFLSSNTLIVYSTTNITETNGDDNNNINNYNLTSSLCSNSLIACLDDIVFLDKNRNNNTKIQTDLILDEVNSTKLKEWVDILSSFHTRNTKSGYVDNVAYWLKNELQNLCEGRVSFHNYTQNDQNQTFNLKNVICSKQGLASSFSFSPSFPSPAAAYHRYNNTIIIGAHYDSRAKNINDTTVRAPGADDNGSGVSALLELVRILSPLNLKYNLEFALFSGEEHGRWGSKNYVKYLDDNNRTKTIDLYINLDMIGYRPSNETKNKVILEYDIGNKYTQNDKNSKKIALFIKKISSDYTNIEAELAKLENSDFISFEAFNHTVIGIHDGGVKKNPHYHDSSDMPDTLNIKYLTSITKMVLATILELDKLSYYLK